MTGELFNDAMAPPCSVGDIELLRFRITFEIAGEEPAAIYIPPPCWFATLSVRVQAEMTGEELPATAIPPPFKARQFRMVVFVTDMEEDAMLSPPPYDAAPGSVLRPLSIIQKFNRLVPVDRTDIFPQVSLASP